MLIQKPKVELIDYTGRTHSDPLYAAKKLIYTKRTRLEQSEETWNLTMALTPEEVARELAYVRDSVRSSWEFVSFTFQISNVGRGFTHQLVRTRTASYAQQSQRVVDMSDFDYTCGPVIANDPRMLEVYETVMEYIREGYQALLEMGAPAQDARGILPTNVATSIIMEVNLRTLADLAAKRDNPRAEGEYHKVFKAMAEVAIAKLPWIDRFLYPPRKSTPQLDKLLTELRGDRSPVERKELNDAMKELDRLKGVWG